MPGKSNPMYTARASVMVSFERMQFGPKTFWLCASINGSTWRKIAPVQKVTTKQLDEMATAFMQGLVHRAVEGLDDLVRMAELQVAENAAKKAAAEKTKFSGSRYALSGPVHKALVKKAAKVATEKAIATEQRRRYLLRVHAWRAYLAKRKAALAAKKLAKKGAK